MAIKVYPEDKRYTMYIARKVANSILMRKKAELMMNFYTHKVTLEIQNGVGSSNISGTLSGLNSGGDLFSYIGFEDGDDPIEPIIEELENISLGEGIKVGNNYRFEVEYPEAADIWAVTPMPWAEGRSWAEGIEKGISGVGHYIRTNSERSRSGGGLQTKNKLRGGRFKNVQYISALLNNFAKSLNE